MKTHCRIHIFLIAIFATLLLISNAPAEVTPNTSVEPKSDIGLKGIGGQFGFVSPYAYGSTTLFGVIFDLGSVPIQTSTLQLEGTGSYWSVGSSSGVKSLELNMTAKYYFSTGGNNLSPFAGGGLSFIRSGIYGPGLDVGIPQASGFGAHGVGGFDMPVGNSMTFRSELRFQFGGFPTIQVTGGLVFPLGKSEPPQQPDQAPDVLQGDEEVIESAAKEAS